MSNIRIKELASAKAELGKFDEFEFVADVPDVEASMKISGKQLRESITPSDHTHPIRDVQGLQDELDKKLNKSGGAISGDFAVLGNTRLRNPMIEEFLEVPEFRYNRIETVVGDKWCAAGAGIIEAVNIDDCTLSIKLESGEISSLRANDLCKGIFYNIAVNNHTEETIDSDDSFGHITHAGFTTVYFKIVECLNTNNYGEWRYELREGFPYHPQTAMNIVAYGNTTDTSRQTSRYETRTYQRFLVGMNDWDIKTENIAAQFGDLSNLLAHGLDMKGYSAYLKNIYLQGFISDLLGDSWFDSQSGNMQLYNRSTGCGISFKNGVLRLGRIDPSKPNEGTDLESLLEDLQEARDTLQKINSDEYVSPVEKTYLKERLSDIHSEYSHLLDQATEYILKQGARAVGDGVRIATGVQRRVVLSDEKWTAYVSAYLLAVATLEKYNVYAFDSSTIDLCLSIFWWAKFRENKGGIKLHTLFDVKTSIPVLVVVTDAKSHDVNGLDFSTYEAGSFYVVDKGYIDFGRLHDIHQNGSFFVTRAKYNIKFKRMYSRQVDKTTGVLCDQIGKLVTPKSLKLYPDKIRRIKYYDAELDREFVFITNNMELDAKDIAMLYKNRWHVELFFKWIKQQLF